MRRVIGAAIYDAQEGGEHPHAKALKGFGGRSVLEVVEDFDGDTFRAVYTVRFAKAVYVLHAFQKKSKSGIATSRHDIDLIKLCLKSATIHYGKRFGEGTSMSDDRVTESSGNVFADLGFEDPEEELLKAKLSRQLRAVLSESGLGEGEAAIVLGLAPPDLSAILASRTGSFSIEQLFAVLIAWTTQSTSKSAGSRARRPSLSLDFFANSVATALPRAIDF